MNNNEREKLLKQVQICDFAINEAVLYLDGHPTNQKALTYYDKYKMLRKEAMDQYQSMCGPLTVNDNQDMSQWRWIDNPWPWELGE